MRASNLYTILLLPLLSSAAPQADNGADSASSGTTTLTSTSTRTITHTMVQGTSTLTSDVLSVTAVPLTAAQGGPKNSNLPDISAPSGDIDTTASLVVAPYPSSSSTTKSTIHRPSASSSVATLGANATLGTKAPLPSTTGIVTQPLNGAASGRVGCGIAELSAVAVGAMVLVWLV